MTINKNESKKIVNVRVKKDSFIKLKHVCFDKCVSMNSLVESLIENYLLGEKNAN